MGRLLAAVPCGHKGAELRISPPMRGVAPARGGAGALLSSAAVPHLYDLMLALDPNAPEQSQNEVLSNVESMIQSGGSLVGHHDWGIRRLAYEIDHRPEAAYHLFQFETDDSSLLERVDHSLKIADGVLRFRIIRLKPGSPPPPTPRPESPRGRDREEHADETRVAARAAADAAVEEPASEGADESGGQEAEPAEQATES
ncbi:MAG: 30S ribosomal protein S6 [Actinobacteria bacterium]|nr:MAG: 30S ribosomal protein S6 [Actinomycetota bacterium]TMM10140.1 MAG: 30S ribosomal protein S6 [Actinomycetota bacterium]